MEKVTRRKKEEREEREEGKRIKKKKKKVVDLKSTQKRGRRKPEATN